MKSASLALLAALLVPAAAMAQDAKPASDAAAHTVLLPSEMKWGPGPPALPKGGQMVVLSGDPTKAGPFVLRAKLPAGYTVPPHWHPTDEQITVLSGSFSMGMGDKVDKKAKAMGAGGWALMPAQMHHFAYTKTGATIQVNAMGPFVINYIDPKDDPRTAAPAH